MTTLKEIRALEWPMTMKENETIIIISFKNDRHHAVTIDSDMTPRQIGEAFIGLGQNIINDKKLG